MPQLRLIALDLDGTLLNPQRRLNPETIEALQEAQASGLIVCLASGRAVTTIKPFAQIAGLKGPIVSANGAYVLDEAGEEILHRGLPAEAIDWLLNFAAERSVHVNHYLRGEIAMNQEGQWADLYRVRVASDMVEVGVGELNCNEATKLLFIGGPDEMASLEAEARSLVPPEWAEIVRSEAEYLEFLPPGISKGWGLMKLAEHLGIKQEETAALGDYSNDQEMIEWAGFSGAMGNALPEVKEAANVVVSDNSHNGAAEFIRLVMNLRRND